QQYAVGARQMAVPVKRGSEARRRRKRVLHAMRLESIQRNLRVLARVKRKSGRMLGKAVPIGEARLLLLQKTAVRQQDPAQLERGRRAVNPAVESTLDEQRRITAVIQVSVRKHDGGQIRGIDRRRRPVLQAQLLVSLKQAAIDQHALLALAHQIARAGDRPCGAQKSQLQDRFSPNTPPQAGRAQCCTSRPLTQRADAIAAESAAALASTGGALP